MLGPLRVAPSKIIISVIIGWLGDINREKEGSKTALPVEWRWHWRKGRLISKMWFVGTP